MIIEFLTELRESADIQFKVFTEGSCFRLYKILKVIFPEAKAYWSDIDNHCITKINGKYYDIGGEVKKEYIENNAYYKIVKSQLKGYALLKYTVEEANFRVSTEKYK